MFIARYSVNCDLLNENDIHAITKKIIDSTNILWILSEEITTIKKYLRYLRGREKSDRFGFITNVATLTHRRSDKSK